MKQTFSWMQQRTSSMSHFCHPYGIVFYRPINVPVCSFGIGWKLWKCHPTESAARGNRPRVLCWSNAIIFRNKLISCYKISLCLTVISVVVRVLDFRLEIADSVPVAALLSSTLGKLFTHIASVTKQYNLIPCDTLAPCQLSCSFGWCMADGHRVKRSPKELWKDFNYFAFLYTNRSVFLKCSSMKWSPERFMILCTEVDTWRQTVEGSKAVV